MDPLQRLIRNLIWFAVGLALGTWAVFANATVPSGTQYCGGSGTSYCAADYQAAALAWGKSRFPEYASTMQVSGFSTPDGGATYTYSIYKGAPISNNYVGSGSVTRSQVCPPNSTGTTTCTCNSGYVESGGSCVEQSCPVGMSKLNGQCQTDTCPDGSKRASGGLCRGAACTDLSGRDYVGGTNWYIVNQCSPVGCVESWIQNSPDAIGGSLGIKRTSSGECTPGSPLPGDKNPDTGCPDGQTQQIQNGVKRCYPKGSCAARGMCGGTINGLDVCNACPPGTSTSTKGTTTDTKTDANNNASTTKSETTATETPGTAGAGSTVTVKTTTTNPDGTNTTETKTQDKGTYCTENPNAPLCKGGSISAQCGTAFSCDGDAVQCQIARSQFERNCGDNAKTPQSDLVTGILGGAQDAQGADALRAAATQSDLGGMLDQSHIVAASCVQDVTVDVMGHSSTMRFSVICPWAEWIGMAIVAAALLGAAWNIKEGFK